jgi:hypothetical protein
MNGEQLTLDEKKEMIIDCYKSTYDKNVAYSKCFLSDNEISNLEKDKFFQARLSYFLALKKEKIVRRLEQLMDLADKDEVSLKAAIKLGEIVYAEAFKEAKDNETRLVLPAETQKQLEEIFTSGSIEAYKQQMREKLLMVDKDPEETINEIVN